MYIHVCGFLSVLSSVSRVVVFVSLCSLCIALSSVSDFVVCDSLCRMCLTHYAVFVFVHREAWEYLDELVGVEELGELDAFGGRWNISMSCRSCMGSEEFVELEELDGVQGVEGVVRAGGVGEYGGYGCQCVTTVCVFGDWHHLFCFLGDEQGTG